jgi:hypothetical protein
LSGGAIGGIIGGILGTVVLLSVAVVCYFLGRRGRTTVIKPLTKSTPNQGEDQHMGSGIGGRLRYPTIDSNHEITESGRIISF